MMKRLVTIGATAAALAATAAFTAPTASADQGRHDQVISCSTNSNHKRTCRLPSGVRPADVTLVQRHSNSRCRDGRDWGVTSNAIWVTNGCRADFAVTAIRVQHRDDDYLWGGRDDRRGDRGWGDNRRGGRGYGRPTQDSAVDVCYRAMNRELGGRRYWSIQYDGRPKLREERHAYELRGRVRIHGPGGFSHLETVCELDGNRVIRFYVDR